MAEGSAYAPRSVLPDRSAPIKPRTLYHARQERKVKKPISSLVPKQDVGEAALKIIKLKPGRTSGAKLFISGIILLRAYFSV